MKNTSWIALLAFAVAPACGSAPKKVNLPHVPTQPVAIGAVAAAAVLTLANPKLAGRKESADEKKKKPRPTRGVQMPASRLLFCHGHA